MVTQSFSVEQLLQQALTHQRAGRVQEAERLYRVILQGQPSHADANHNLGLLALRNQQAALAIGHLKVALQANPAQTQYWVSYIEALMQMGQIEAARQMLAQGRGHGLQGAAVEALAARLGGAKAGDAPTRAEIDHVGALFNLGRYAELEVLARELTARYPQHGLGWKMLGVVLNQFGRSDEALAPMHRAVALLPGDPEVHYNLGVMLKHVGRLAEAEASYRRALELKPDFAEAHGDLGLTFQAQGRLPEAEASYRRVLDVHPDWVDAHYDLGNTLRDQGRLAEAEASYRRALALKPDYVEAHNDLGNALLDQGRLAEAEASYRRALEFQPEFAEAHNNLGATLKDQGRLGEAEASLRRALAINSNFAEAHNNLGAILKDQGRLAEAEASCRRALGLQSDYAEAHNNLGATLKDQGRLAEAQASYREALEIKPDFAEAHSNLGNAFVDQGRLAEAEASYRRALALKPDHVELHNNLGKCLQGQERLPEADASFRRALELRPDYAEAHNNFGNLLQAQGRSSEAEASFRRALAFKPDYAEAQNNLGLILHAQGRLSEAEASLHRALELKPDYAEAHNNLGLIFQVQGRASESEGSLRRALALKPDYAAAHNNLGNTLLGQSGLSEAEACYRRALELEPDYEDAFGNLLFALNYDPDKSAQEIFAAYREYDERFGLPQRGTWRAHANSRQRGRRLKVGYVSPDLRQHTVRYFLEPLLACHDKGVVQVYAYAELQREDAVTARYRGYADQWVPTRGLSDAALAERIRADGIDILVDLAGHTGGNRLQVFARKPAPVSVSWLGYGYTTGLRAVDYLLTDEASAPAGSEGLFSETPWRVATPGYVYRPDEGMGAVSRLPAAAGGPVTFGTLTRAVRINHRTIRVWSEILKRVQGSRLVIDSGNFREAAMQEALAEKFAAHGVSRGRLAIGCHSPPWEVLRGMDIGLDCFPHNSGTTLFESLYMGVPYVTLAGRPSVGRLGSSILQGVGHAEWIARSEQEYVEKAVALASELPKLALIREQLRGQMQASPLMDEAGFARKVEAAYREMFEQWASQSAGT